MTMIRWPYGSEVYRAIALLFRAGKEGPNRCVRFFYRPVLLSYLLKHANVLHLGKGREGGWGIQ